MQSRRRLLNCLVLVVAGCSGVVRPTADGGVETTPGNGSAQTPPDRPDARVSTEAGAQQEPSAPGRDAATTQADAGSSVEGGSGSLDERDSGTRDTGVPAGPGPVLLQDGVFLETFASPAAITSRNGPLSIERYSVARFRQNWDPMGVPDSRGNGADPPGDIRITDGRLVVESGMQNYGDTLVRINQPFDGNRIELDAQLTTKTGGGPELLFTDRPYASPSYTGENGNGPHMDAGFGLFWQAQGCPFMRRWVNGVQADHTGNGDSVPGPYSCVGNPPTIGQGVLNHVVIQFSSSEVTVTIDGSVVGHYPASPIASGYVMIGTHNHASQKYSSTPTNESIWDNITWNGGPPKPSRVAQVAAAPGHFFGYPLPASAGTAWTTTSLALQGATQAWLVVDVGSNRPDLPANITLQFQLNGHAVREAAWQYANRPAWLATTFSIPLQLSDLVEGPNSIRLFSASLSTFSPHFANADIVVR